MTKTVEITVRLDADLANDVERILARLGLLPSQAIMSFFEQVRLHQGLPFEMRIPNASTRRALADAETRRGLVSYRSTEDLLSDLTRSPGAMRPTRRGE